MIPRDSSMDAPSELIFHDFVSFIILSVPLKPFFRKKFENFEKSRKKIFMFRHQRVPPLEKKIEKIDFFQRKSNFLHLNMSSTRSKLSFEVQKRGFAQIFQIFTFLPTKFTSMTNFIRWPLAANIAIKSDCFWYQWKAKDQNIYFWSSFTIHGAFQLRS